MKKVNPEKVDEALLLSEAERIKEYYKDSFLLGFQSGKHMKFLHFAGGEKNKFTIKKGVHKNIVMLDSTKSDYEGFVKTIGESSFSQCVPIPASQYFGI